MSDAVSMPRGEVVQVDPRRCDHPALVPFLRSNDAQEFSYAVSVCNYR
jgi:hypothetical protein